MKKNISLYSIIGLLFFSCYFYNINYGIKKISKYEIQKIEHISFIIFNENLSYSNYIIIKNAKDDFEAIDYEKKYLEKEYGKRNQSWILIEQELLEIKNKKIDKLVIRKLDNNEQIIFHFDITDTFGKGLLLNK